MVKSAFLQWPKRATKIIFQLRPNVGLTFGHGLETQGDSQNQNKTKSKTTKENKSAEEEGSIKNRRFAEVETQDLDALVEDSQE